MKVIVGLGNPGTKFDRTRHNVGFWAVDSLSARWQLVSFRQQFRALISTGRVAGETVMLVKPQTYMNRSGESVGAVANYFQVAPQDFLIVFDDLNLDPGVIRLRGKGSAGGHNGLKSVIAALGTQEIPRLRIGIGMNPPEMDAADYVLASLRGQELEVLRSAAEQAAAAAEAWVMEGIDLAMSKFNGKVI